MQRAECWEAEGEVKIQGSEISIGITRNCEKTPVFKSMLKKKVIKGNEERNF